MSRHVKYQPCCTILLTSLVPENETETYLTFKISVFNFFSLSNVTSEIKNNLKIPRHVIHIWMTRSSYLIRFQTKNAYLGATMPQTDTHTFKTYIILLALGLQMRKY